MPSERLKARLKRHRAMTSITLRIPVDVVDALKRIAPLRGLAGYQTLLKFYLSEGLRRDEAKLNPALQQRLLEALRRRGVSADVLEQAAIEARQALVEEDASK